MDPTELKPVYRNISIGYTAAEKLGTTSSPELGINSSKALPSG